jgi:hypothetical protein
MSRISQSAGKKRFAIVVGLAMTVGVAWLLMSRPGVDQISEEIVSANVLEIIQRKTTNQPKSSPQMGLGIVVVQLPDGGRARVFAPVSKLVIGSKIAVKVKRFSDGSRHVTGGGEAPPPEQDELNP